MMITKLNIDSPKFMKWITLRHDYDIRPIFVRPLRYTKDMNTINDLINEIYMDNEQHLAFIENMNGGDCDCGIHITLNTICKYAGIEVE